MSWQFRDSSGELCGTASGRLHSDELSLNENCKKMGFEFSFFSAQIPREEIFPLYELSLFDIDYDRRRQGLGREALRAFMNLAVDEGAKTAFLRIGTTGDDYCREVSWKRRFYRSEGWVTLNRPVIGALALVWMYRLMEGSKFETSVTIEDKPYNPLEGWNLGRTVTP